MARPRPTLAPLLLSALAAAAVLCVTACETLPNLAPTAEFVISPVSPIYAGETSVVFNASGSRDLDGRIKAFIWDFGDGSGELQAGGATVTHVFPDTAARCVEITYTVLLTTIDDQDERDTASQPVKVIERPAPGSRECQ
jgi:hypothetical protein